MSLRRVIERLLAAVGYLLFGVFVGAVGTIAHRDRIELFGVTLWVGIVGALLAVLLIAAGLRGYLDERVWVLVFAVGVVLAVLVLSTSGAERSVLVPGSASGFGLGELWTFGSAIMAFIPVIWPDLRPVKARARAAGDKMNSRLNSKETHS